MELERQPSLPHAPQRKDREAEKREYCSSGQNGGVGQRGKPVRQFRVRNECLRVRLSVHEGELRYHQHRDRKGQDGVYEYGSQSALGKAGPPN